MTARSLHRSAVASQRGLSLVEMMVGIAVGLFIVAGASMLVTTQLGDNRRLLLETQIQQDLRATADIITRELRRAGSVEDAVGLVWAPAGSASSSHANVTISAGLDEVGFEYERSANAGPWGFKLETRTIGSVDRGVIRTKLSTGGWQDLTDAFSLDVTDFRVEELSAVTETLPCARACSANLLDETCWPTLTVRTYEIEIAARAVSDANVRRSLRSTVRLRNDQLAFSAALPASQACP